METHQWWDQPALTASNCCQWQQLALTNCSIGFNMLAQAVTLPLPAGTPVLAKQHGDLEPRRDSGGQAHSWHPEERERNVSATIKPSR